MHQWTMINNTKPDSKNIIKKKKKQKIQKPKKEINKTFSCNICDNKIIL